MHLNSMIYGPCSLGIETKHQILGPTFFDSSPHGYFGQKYENHKTQKFPVVILQRLEKIPIVILQRLDKILVVILQRLNIIPVVILQCINSNPATTCGLDRFQVSLL